MTYDFIDTYFNTLEEKTFLSRYINQFYIYARKNLSSRLSRRTLYLMVRNIEGFEKFMFYQYPLIKNINDINEHHINEFKSFCIDGLNNDNRTVNSKLTALRYFFDYITKEKIIDYNICLNIKKLKNNDSQYLNYLNNRDLNILFSEMRMINYGERDVLISKLIVSTGALIQSVLNIRMEDLDINNKSVVIDNINYPISSSTFKTLSNYLSLRRDLDSKKSNYLFLSRTGNAYQIRSFQTSFKRAITNTSIPVNSSPIVLRNTFRVAEEAHLKKLITKNRIELFSDTKNPLHNLI